MDVLCALSTCPGGDLSTWGWKKGAGGTDDMLQCCRPLGVDVFKLTDPAILEDHQPLESPSYRGMHGITPVDFDQKSQT